MNDYQCMNKPSTSCLITKLISSFQKEKVENLLHCVFVNPRTRSPRSWTTFCPIRTWCWLRSLNWRVLSLKLRYAHLCISVTKGMQVFDALSICLCAWMQVNSVSAKEQLSHCVKEIMALLTERQTMLAQALESSRQRRAEALANQVAEKRSLLEHAGLMAFTQELLKENDPSSFVHAARLTHNRWDDLLSADNTNAKIWKHWTIISLFLRLAQSIESMQRFSLSADPSFRHFQLDVSRELKLLTDLNFIQGRKSQIIRHL